MVQPAAGRRPVRGAVADVLKGGAGFAAGYLVRARTAGAGGDMVGQVRSRVAGGLQAGNAQLTRRAGEVTEKVRRR